MLIWSILLVLSSVVSLVQSQNGVLEQSFWPSAVPLAVRSPYFSCWLLTTEGRNLLAQWPRFWNYASSGSGDPFLTWQGLAKVDGTTYQWLGDWSDRPTPGINRVNLTGFRVTPTSTVFEMLAGPMSINVTFLTPIEPSDWVSQSIPFSYVSLEAASIDGSKHDFKVYADITAEWVSGNRSANVAWNTTVGNSVIYHEIFLSSPSQFEEIFGQADDGTMYHAVLNGLDVSYQTGLDEDCRGQFQNNSVLTNKQDTNFGNITGSSNSPVFAFAMDLGSISSTSAPVVWTLGYVRDPAIQYVTSSGQVQLRSPYFVTQYSSMADVISDFLINYTTTSQRAQALDSKIQQDALNISSEYADLVSLAARQVFGSIDITISKGSDGQWNTSDIMIFMKDMGNTRRINPVEVLYQAFPIFLYLNSSFGRPLLAPLLEYEDSSQFSLPYAAADLGNGYPVALGNNSGHSQGIEQSGNMLIMTLAHARASGDGYLIDRYYDLLKGWAKYLVNNTLEPTASQQSADQENVADSSNLAVKGIIGIQAMAEMSKAMGENDDETYFSQQVMTLIGEWESLALSSDQQHLLLDYGDESSWALVYNLYADRLLGTNLVNSSVCESHFEI
ncbi:DUF1793-domain-containing protein [Obba rivulosa]|uniref:DUF1793-domain-containing protein n=1 Tax=Obba rivulosa TaxID=1052685 RepID=A0A8E2AQ49_9APHY|nr:DUF1793-domain-containing protein [Obba rivulosa]